MNNPTLIRHLCFHHGQVQFALPLSEVVEVVNNPKLRVLPFADRALAGFAVYRERPLPVFDPLALAGLSPASSSAAPTVVVASCQGYSLVGYALTQVGAMADLQLNELEPAGERNLAAFSGQLTGSAEPVLILDPSGLARSMGWGTVPLAAAA